MTRKYKLQEMRKRAGFKSAKAFADHIGMKKDTYTNYEQERRPITLELAWEFADVLGCTLDELAGREFHPPGEVISDPYERELVDLYRSVGPAGKGHILDDARGQSALSLNVGTGRADDEPEVMEGIA